MDQFEALKQQMLQSATKNKELKAILREEKEKARDIILDNFSRLFWPEVERLSGIVHAVAGVAGFTPRDYHGQRNKQGIDSGEDLDMMSPDAGRYLYAGTAVSMDSEGLTVYMYYTGEAVASGERSERAMFVCSGVEQALKKLKCSDDDFSSLALAQVLGNADRVTKLLDALKAYVMRLFDDWMKILSADNKALGEKVDEYRNFISRLEYVKDMEDGSVEVTLGGKKYHATLVEDQDA